MGKIHFELEWGLGALWKGPHLGLFHGPPINIQGDMSLAVSQMHCGLQEGGSQPGHS